MGCVSSKQQQQAVSVTPANENSGKVKSELGRTSQNESGRTSENCCESLSFRLENLHKFVQSEHLAAGWPAWLSAVAGDAIHGWIPLRPDAFHKLQKIGQGTYSNVFKAREIETGKIVALKKVRFNNLDPESVRFMAREIMILRKLDHPNIMKLEGLITSRSSCTLYLVFEYMEHDIIGLLGNPDIKFSQPQIKCYMKQLLSAVEYFHSRGVMHRDIKGSNLLVNNEGILKVADFGLANFIRSGKKHPLTSRVVTLWYRPPELLLGSTDYDSSVDLWSVGCVFAELLVRIPILQGKTEVEQLHKIFKLCGSPPDEYWKRIELPRATLIYDGCFKEYFKDLPPTSVHLLQTLLSVEPYKRGTATSALSSEYFKTQPYACDPSSLPKYLPSKEIDARQRATEEARKKNGRVLRTETMKPSRKPQDLANQTQNSQKVKSRSFRILEEEKSNFVLKAQKPSRDIHEYASHMKNASQGDIPFSGLLQISNSSGFAWAKSRKDDTSIRSRCQSFSKGHSFNALDSSVLNRRNNLETINHDNKEFCGRNTNSRHFEISKASKHNQWSRFDRLDSLDASDEYHSQELSALYQGEDSLSTRSNLSYQDQGEKIGFSGPLLSKMHTVDELLERNERHIRRTVRKSWFHKGKKNGKKM
ncbi:protein IMPAIRED IN BABA-INDUCED STERILITY 1-like isoform X1 [Trifolium pratense]|uniref:protein IMPAIRED IN BABA-INDUCED STERILITY 1-like isoform X1 n=1 Tax=Trifolium pratense TaxID=57577 RepID=UPI001E695784|nr:protein IMPAIRED IN BABA-INDUCED STERILITY 1-like isoform X1 [Trifolium pratense]